MSLVGLFMVLLAGLGFVLLDLFRKVLVGRLAVVPLLFWMTAGAVPLFGSWALLGGSAPEPSYWLPGLASTTLNVLANLCFLRSVQLAALSSTIPLLSLTPVLAALVSVPLLGELPTNRQWWGIALVVVGAVALALEPQQDEKGESRVSEWSPPAKSSASRNSHLRGVLLMGAVAFLWSLALPLDKMALRYSTPGFHGLVLHAGVALCVGGMLVVRGRLKELSSARGSAVLVASTVVCGAAALAFQLLALERIFAGLVETLKRGVGSVGALVVGAVVLGESWSILKLLAVAIMAVGVALVLV